MSSKYCYPTLPWHKFNANNGLFLSESYYRSTGSDHTGQDINGNGGGDTDYGALVRSITDGVVTDAKWYSTWGNIVLIYHPGPNVWSQYAHLSKMNVKKGQTVTKGQVIGAIGKGAGNIYTAHLHFEIRYKDVPAWYWPSTGNTRAEARALIKANYVDPIAFLVKNNADKF